MESSRENLVASALIIGVLVAGISWIGLTANHLFKQSEIAVSKTLSAPDPPRPRNAISRTFAAVLEDERIVKNKFVSKKANAKDEEKTVKKLITNRSRTNGPLPASYIARQLHEQIRLRSIMIKNGGNIIHSLIAYNGSNEAPTLIPSEKRLFEYLQTVGIEFEWHEGNPYISKHDLFVKCKLLARPVQSHELL